MARLVSDPTFLEEAAEALDFLDCTGDSARAREWVSRGGSPEAPKNPKELHILCLRAAIGSNKMLKTKGTPA